VGAPGACGTATWSVVETLVSVAGMAGVMILSVIV
jgi:hypothetical protein